MLAGRSKLGYAPVEMRANRVRAGLRAWVLGSLVLGACGGAPDEVATSLSPRPHLDIVEALREDLEAERHPADGGGAVWIVEDDSSYREVRAGDFGQWTFL